MEKWLGHKMPRSEESGRLSAEIVLHSVLTWFTKPGDGDDYVPLELPDNSDMYAKILKGSETLPVDDARYMIRHFSTEIFGSVYDEVYNEGSLDQEAEERFLQEFEKYGYQIGGDVTEDVGKCLYSILENIVERFEKPSIWAKKITLEGNVLKVGRRRITLPAEIAPSDSILDDVGSKYIDALLEVYCIEEGRDIIKIEDLGSLKPDHIEHLKYQRMFFFRALNLERKLRDIFIDGADDFERLKEEELDHIGLHVTEDYSSPLARVKTVLKISVGTVFKKSRSGQLGFLTGDGEKQGVVHMLVNDGKVRWVF